jgi:hypothetical protein
LILVLLCLSANPSSSARSAQETAEAEEEAGYEFRNEEEIRAALAQILGSGEFRILERAREKPEEPKPEPKEEEDSKVRNWFQRLLDWLAGIWDWLVEKLTPDTEQVRPVEPFETPPWIQFVMNIILYSLAGGVLLSAIALIIKAVLKRAPKESAFSTKAKAQQLETASPPGELPSDEYLARAVSLADSGNYKAAVRELLLGTMSWIERHGLIRYRRGLSNRDYLRAVTDRAGQRESLRPIVLHFEQVTFGRREATAGGFKECLAHFRKAFSVD